jgi:hypothetical protein
MRPFRGILVIALLAFIAQSVVAGETQESSGGASYAINLASSLRQFTADDLPKLDVVQPHRVYMATFVKGGRTWHRLRLGFFGSRSEAKAAVDGLKEHYPDAWIVEVSVAERLDSSATVLVHGKPHSVVEESVDERQDFTEHETAAIKPSAAADAGTATPPARQSLPVERLALGGAEYGDDNASYYYAGLLVPFPGSDLGNGFVQRYWLDWLRYEYESGDRTIRATAPGASVALGYGRAATAGAWSIYLGPVWRNTDLSPDDRGSDVRGAQWGMNVSLQGDRRISDNWRANGIASFTSGTASYWTRGRLTRKLSSGPAAGLEVVLHGNDDYSAWQAGAVVLDIRLTPQASLGLKGGARKTSGADTGAYLGIELARSF